MRFTVAAGVCALAAAGSGWPPSAYSAAQAKLAQMTLEDKLAMVHGYGGGYVGDVPANASLGLPPLNLEDGPQGVADGVTQVTAWPSALTVTMTWDESLMFAYGAAMGAEQVIKGTNVMLGPGMNLARVPWGGRTFEYLGEDPILAGKMVTAEVAGIQSNIGLSACSKHYVQNEQESDRSGMSANVPRRVAWELYYQPFQYAVNAGTGSIMCSYNRVNNTWACENEQALSDLKNIMGFDGWVMSDWGATHSTIPAAVGGLDQQMPDAGYFGAALAAAVAAGNVSLARVDDMVMRMLVPMYALNLISNPPTGSLSANATSFAHNTLARVLAEQSTVLLKNDKATLPLNAKTLKSVGVFGDETTVTGHGSGGVVTPYVITPFQGIYTYLNGPLPPRPVSCVTYNNTDFYQPGNPSVTANSADECCAICTGNYGCNAWAFVASDSTCWLKPDTTGNRSAPGVIAGTCAAQPAPPPGAVNVTYNAGTDLSSAAALAAAVDVAIVVVATTSSEGSDRADLSLGSQWDQLVAAVVAANPNTVVVVRCPGACFMPWLSSVPAVIYNLMPGQEAGNALANVLFGDVNPSGKLPVSFPNDMNDTWLGNPVNPEQYPGTDRGNGWPEVDYTEELLMGYRWYDAQNTAPLFPFGHGLSYTNFTYSGLSVSGSVSATSNATIALTVTNSGPVQGSEVAQLYLGFPASAGEPPKLLKGFSKVGLASKAAAQVVFTVTAADCSIWDLVSDSWMQVGGSFQVLVGSSSRDIRLTGTLTSNA